MLTAVLSIPALPRLETSLSPELAGARLLLTNTMSFCGTSQNNGIEMTGGFNIVQNHTASTNTLVHKWKQS